jgi:cation diffusion facilitator CzcD-associated flavoprotein CzcO
MAEAGELTAGHPGADFDVVIVGAGFGGLYALYELRKQYPSAVVLEAGHGVGGTWYWNRYPGARVDVYSYSYSYSFSPELEQDWDWKEYFASQAELEAYANHVADRFDLRRDIRLGFRVSSASWDADRSRWTLCSADGEQVTGKLVIWATGGYTTPATPDIPGLADFTGELYHAPRWPHQPVEFAGKRIGVIGTGATGMQVITALAAQPIEHLTVFQRTAEFVTPAGPLQVSEGYTRNFKASYREYRAAALESTGGVLYDHQVQTDISGMSDAEFRAFMRKSFDHPFGYYPLSGVKGLLTSEDANRRVAEFIRSEIRRRVHDPETAEKLIPRGYHLGSRRIIGERGYLEVYNRRDVTLVDVKADPIERLEAAGVRTASAFYELDMLILATGFDSGTGALLEIDIAGKNGARLKDYWASGPVTYLGMAMAGMPNSFMIWGPGSPSIRSQGFVAIEQQVQWLGGLFEHLRAADIAVIESTPAADEAWTNHAEAMVQASLLAHDNSQYYGSNVKGKPRRYVAYTGGSYVYRILCDDVRDHGYEGFEQTRADGSAATASPKWSGPRTDGSLPFRLGNSAI